MIQVFKIVTGIDHIDKDSLFPSAADISTRGHSQKIFKKRSRLKIRRTSFSQRIVNDWNSLPENIVDSETLDQFKARLESHWKPERYITLFS